MMKDWPFGIGFQEQVSNHSKRLSLKVVVVSVGGKVGYKFGRYGSERRIKLNLC
jgi:hypothetical protein